MTDALSGYPVVVTIPVAWGEMDSLGHVNNIMYFRYFETARIVYLEKSGLMEIMKRSGIGPILARTSATYKKPVYYPDTLSVGARVATIGTTSFIMEYLVVSKALGAAAFGDAVIVTYDYTRRAKANIPDEVVKAIESLEGCAPGSRCVVEDFDGDVSP